MKKTLSVFLGIFLSVACTAQQFGWLRTINAPWYYQLHHVVSDGQGNICTDIYLPYSTDIEPGPAVLNLDSGTYVLQFDSSGIFNWASQIPGKIISMETGPSSNLLVTGFFSGTADFNSGSGEFTMTSPDTSLFIININSSGEFLWADKVDVSFPDNFAYGGVCADINGNITVTGSFVGQTDFDPGDDEHIIDAGSVKQTYILRIDPEGNFMWVKTFNGSPNMGRQLGSDQSGNVYISGDQSGPVDFNTGAGEYILDSDGTYIVKLDLLGNLVWAGTIDAGPIYFDVSPMGIISFTGLAQMEMADIDPGPGTYTLPASQAYVVIFVAKLDLLGNLVWAGRFDAPDYFFQGPSSITTDAEGNVYSCGWISSTTDFDPGPGVHSVEVIDNFDAESGYIVKLDSDGNFIWVQHFPTTDFAGFSGGTGITTLPSGDICVTGYVDGPSADFDVSDNEAFVNYGSFIYVIRENSCSDLAVIIDDFTDVTCALPGGIETHGANGEAPYSYLWNTSPEFTGQDLSADSSGSYSVTVTDNSGCARTRNIVLDGPTIFAGYDLNINLVSTPFRTGFPSTITVDAFNDGCIPVSGEIKVILDDLVTYNSADPAPGNISGDTLIWYFNSWVSDSGHFTADINVTTNLDAAFGDTVSFAAYLTPEDEDIAPVNNRKVYEFIVVNAYDPNYKAVYPAGECDSHYVLRERMSTTLHFQNTGNAEAINIYVLDILSNGLDLNSLSITGSSHEVITEILPGNVLKFNFNNIMLADSFSNEPASHGYVIYEADPLPGLASGTEINHTAAQIYFDFNPAILTNHLFSVVMDEIPLCEMPTEISLSENKIFTLFPNPASENIRVSSIENIDSFTVTLSDVSGRSIRTIYSTSDMLSLDIQGLSCGLYILQIDQSGKSEMHKFIKQ